MSESQSVEEQENDAVKLFVYLHSDIVNEVVEDNFVQERPKTDLMILSEEWCLRNGVKKVMQSSLCCKKKKEFIQYFE